MPGNEPLTEPSILVDIPATGRLLGDICRAEVYRLIYAGELQSIAIGRRRFVRRDSIERLARDGCSVVEVAGDAST